MTTETNDPSCLFCRIARRESPSTPVFEDEEFYAFRDIAPKAPTHVLVIPKKHLPRLSAATPDDAPLLARLLLAFAEIARREKASDYRLVVNDGPDAGQSVDHLHFHLLAGRFFTWPPG
ncbi:MAG TPA: histidine triad nucleotide-binding protein, partial [Thermoanaerobaculia bacterium]|nr:histidine triad nucleotide-binding protein [Thermoanaerobaculia bacterium]HQR68899.1 histidine triad nucleotide-binding protein [Thermoanaerobaculia bacterium]